MPMADVSVQNGTLSFHGWSTACRSNCHSVFTVSQWRLSHHLCLIASVHEAFRLLPQTYNERTTNAAFT